jgi:hypothetical protein
VVTHRWVTKQSSQGKQTERGIRGIFIGFDANKKGYLVYCPGSRTIITSEDVTFDEYFSTAIATSWQQHKDALELHPVVTDVPLINDTIEQTSDIDDCPELVPSEEGDNDDDEADDDDSVDAVADDLSVESSTFDTPAPPPVEEPLHVLDNSNNVYNADNPCRSKRIPVPNKKCLPNATPGPTLVLLKIKN